MSWCLLALSEKSGNIRRNHSIQHFEVVRSKADMEKPLESSRFQGELPMFVKQMFHGNANGDIGPLVLIIQIKGFKDGEWYHEEVTGLTRESDSTLKGGLYCAPTRCMKGDAQPGPQNAWNHYFRSYPVPFCQKITALHDLRDEDNLPYDHVVTMDNEEVILREAEDPAVRNALDDARINLLKVPPSTTPHTNFMDRSSVFRSEKAGIKTVLQNLTETGSKLLEKNLQK